MCSQFVNRSVAAGMLLVVVAGCSGGSSSDDTSLSLSLIDRPIDGISELNITITEFWIKPQGSGPAFQLDMVDTPVTVNLLALTPENPALFVDRANIPAGTYNWLEMRVDDSSAATANAITDDGLMQQVEIDVPGDRIRLINGLEFEPNESVHLSFDWDVRRGLTEAVGRNLYILKPVIRALGIVEFGSVVGNISSASVLAAENDCNADDEIDEDYDTGNVVYIFEGDVSPGEMGVFDPYATFEAEDIDNDGDYEYRASLIPGTYTVAATCQGGLDSDADDGLNPTIFFLEPLSGDGTVTFALAGEVRWARFLGTIMSLAVVAKPTSRTLTRSARRRSLDLA